MIVQIIQYNQSLDLMSVIFSYFLNMKTLLFEPLPRMCKRWPGYNSTPAAETAFFFSHGWALGRLGQVAEFLHLPDPARPSRQSMMALAATPNASETTAVMRMPASLKTLTRRFFPMDRMAVSFWWRRTTWRRVRSCSGSRYCTFIVSKSK